MGTVFKKTATKPIPAGAKLIVRKGQRLAEWKDAKGKTRTAPVTTGKDGDDRIVVTARTYTAKYRDGSGIVKEVATGCRDETAARSILSKLERRAELVKGEVITAAEDAVIDHQATPLVNHLDAYLVHLKAKGDSSIHLADTHRLAKRVIADCGFMRLADVRRESVESWLVQRAAEGMAARTRNSYLQAMRGLCNWCIETARLTVNPLARVAKADEVVDRRRTRRALTEDELRRLLDVACRRPLAEYGRLTVHKPKEQTKQKRDTWKMLPLTADDLVAATDRARTRLARNLELISAMEFLGRERALIYKTLVLTGLRKGELASITVGQVVLDAAMPYLILNAADEKNREGSTIPLRADLAADLRQWLADRATALQDARSCVASVLFDSKHMERPKRNTGDFVGHDVQSCLPLTDVPTLPPDTPLFTVPRNLVRILDRDLRLAEIPKVDERGRTVDVHSLRHTFGTLLSMGGVAPRTAQAAMRHSKIDLTMNVYTDPKLLDVAGAMEALPSLPLSVGEQVDAIVASATGTDDLPASQFAPKFAPNSGKSSMLGAILDKVADESKRSTATDAVAVSGYSVNKKDPLTTLVNGPFKRGRRDSNPQPPDRQSGTLTN